MNRNRIRGNVDLEAASAEGRAEILDSGESQLIKAVRAGKPWVFRFVLSRLGRQRGYAATLSVERQVVGRVVVFLLRTRPPWSIGQQRS